MISVQVSAAPTVQAVKDAAQATVTALADGWVLFDGLNPGQGLQAKSLTVGGTWDPEMNTLSTENVVQVQTTESGAARRVTEITAVSCLAYSGDGVSSFETHRANVNAALTALRDQLRAVTSVGGLPAMAQVTDQHWAQVFDDAGQGAMAMFTVTVRVMP